MTTQEFTVYMAGFFDGEGYVGAYRTDYTRKSGKEEHTMAVRVIIGQKYPEVLQLAHEIWGGSIYSEIDKRTGNTFWRWEIRGRKASDFVIAIQPYVIVKARQCKLVLEYQSLLGTKDNFDRKVEIQNLIKTMNTPMGFGRVKPELKERIES